MGTDQHALGHSVTLVQDAQSGSATAQFADPASLGKHQLSPGSGFLPPVSTPPPASCWTLATILTEPSCDEPTATEPHLRGLNCARLHPRPCQEAARESILVPFRLEMESAELGIEIWLLTSAGCHFLPRGTIVCAPSVTFVSRGDLSCSFSSQRNTTFPIPKQATSS